MPKDRHYSFTLTRNKGFRRKRGASSKNSLSAPQWTGDNIMKTSTENKQSKVVSPVVSKVINVT